MGQTPRSRSQVNNNGTNGKVLSQGIFMGNIKGLAFTVQTLLGRLKLQRVGQNDRQDQNNMPPIFDLGGIKGKEYITLNVKHGYGQNA